MPLQIQVGCKYRTRSGDVVEIIRNRGKMYVTSFVGFIKGQAIGILFFTPEGNNYGDRLESDYDLIEEITEPIKNGEG